MRTLDIDCFPHIFDSIFAFADFEALLLLRLTCRALRDRVEDDWGHLQWKVFSEEEVVHNKRGVKVRTDSSCLRFTSVLDLYCEMQWATSEEVPVCLRPEVIRFDSNALWYYPMNSHAQSLIITKEGDIPCLVNAAGKPAHAHGPRNIIYRLHFDTNRSDFETIGDIPWAADVFLVLSGCPVFGGPVRDLCHSIMCPIDHSVKLARHDDVHFYFVDVPSWFDAPSHAAGAERSPPPRLAPSSAFRRGMEKRLDQSLTRFDSFYNYLLNSARVDGVEKYEGWWPSDRNLKYLSKVHYITREEMRQRVGDKAFNLTFAPQVLRPLTT